jgi:sugar transferase (PEP-CTERM/EpsH1 system associated)
MGSIVEILYIAHCVPWPPDKGDRIRAFHSVSTLATHHRVHLACLTRNAEEAEAASDLRDRLASVRIEVLDLSRSLLRGFLGLARGGSFTVEFHHSPALQAHIRSVLANHPIQAVILLSSSMAGYAPATVPFLADWGDVDSEKRFQYARMRFPGFPHWFEGRRLRRVEREFALRARRTFLTTQNELQLFMQIAPEAATACCGNGVDVDYFDPGPAIATPGNLRGRNYIAFVGVLNYFPNSDGACRFAEDVFPQLRRRDPQLELVLVGRNPAPDVMKLANRAGITVTGAVPDVRPYLAGARAVVVPLRIARGIQNKVLEALAMGKRVLASEEVCRTFMPDCPTGLIGCRSPDDYADAVADLPATPEPDWSIVAATRARFSWAAALEPILTELNQLEQKTPEFAAD